MSDFIWNFVLSSVWGWIGTAGVVALICLAIAWFIPPLRPYAIMVLGVVVSAATIYTKGSRDRAKLEQERKEEAVRKAREAYDEIDKRPDSDSDVAKRLRDNGF